MVMHATNLTHVRKVTEKLQLIGISSIHKMPSLGTFTLIQCCKLIVDTQIMRLIYWHIIIRTLGTIQRSRKT